MRNLICLTDESPNGLITQYCEETGLCVEGMSPWRIPLKMSFVLSPSSHSTSWLSYGVVSSLLWPHPFTEIFLHSHWSQTTMIETSEINLFSQVFDTAIKTGTWVKCVNFSGRRYKGSWADVRGHEVMKWQAQYHSIAFMRSIGVEAEMGYVLKQLCEKPRFYMDKSNCNIA